MIWVALSCSSPVPDGVDSAAIPGSIVVATVASDYATGALAVVDPLTLEVMDSVASTSGDPALDAWDGVLYEINRFTYDAVQVFREPSLSVPSVEFSTGEGSNPQGVVACPDRLWVPLYEVAEIGVFEPLSGQKIATVALDTWADADGSPEAAAGVRMGDFVVMPMQRLDRTLGWIPADDGRVIAWPCTGGDPVADVIVGPNPQVATLPGNDRLVGVVTATEQGGVFELDPLTGDLALRLHAAGAGGEAYRAAWDRDGSVVVLGHDADWHWQITCVSPTGSASVGWTGDAFLSAVETDDVGGAWVTARPGFTDTVEAGGLLRFDVATCSADPALILDLPPFDVALR